jgi:hypothetical protein
MSPLFTAVFVYIRIWFLDFMNYRNYSGTIGSLGVIEELLELEKYHQRYDSIIKRKGDLKRGQVNSQNETKEDPKKFSRT